MTRDRDRARGARPGPRPAEAPRPAETPAEPAAPGQPGPPGRPVATTLRSAVWLLAAEAVALVAVCVYVAWQLGTTSSQSRGSGAATLVFTVLCAALVGWLARSLAAQRSWARGPAIVIEILLLPLGYYMIQGGAAWAGIPSLLAGLFGAGLLLAPATRESLGIDD